MGEIQRMCDMYMDEAGIPMLVTMSKEKIMGSRLKTYGSRSIHIQLMLHNGGLNERLNILLI